MKLGTDPVGPIMWHECQVGGLGQCNLPKTSVLPRVPLPVIYWPPLYEWMFLGMASDKIIKKNKKKKTLGALYGNTWPIYKLLSVPTGWVISLFSKVFSISVVYILQLVIWRLPANASDWPMGQTRMRVAWRYSWWTSGERYAMMKSRTWRQRWYVTH